MRRNLYKSGMILSLVMILMSALTGTASATGTVTDIPNPDGYACTQPGYIDFETYIDGFNLSADAISGVQFTTTGGYTWRVGDFATGLYNGKYPSGAYTSQGTHWAWLGVEQGTGRIDFVNGPASYFSLLAGVGNSPVYLQAYDASNNLLDTAGPAGYNIYSGHMAELAISHASADIAYVIVHDSGNYFAVDSICTDAPGVGNFPPIVSLGGPYIGDEGSAISLDGTGSSDPDGDTLTYAWSVDSALCSFDDASSAIPDLTCTDNGSFNITLTVDDGQATNSDTVPVTVNNVAPTITSVVAGSAMACGQSNGLTINFNDPASANDAYTAVINWGDASQTTYAAVSSGFLASHAYAVAGQYTVSVTVSDEDGGASASATTSLTLNYTIVGGGVLQPINQNGSSVFKYKSTIPVKIKVAGCDGSFPGNLTISIDLLQLSGSAPYTSINEPISTSAADTTGFMRFAGSPDFQYIYNLATRLLPDPSATYKITLTILQTLQTITADFGLKP